MEAIPTQRSTDTVAAMKRRPLRAVVFVPGALFWALLIAGFVTHSDTLLGVATTFAVVSIITVVTFKVREGAAA